MLRRYGAFIVVEVGELERDRLLAGDSPYLPPFEIILAHGAAGRQRGGRRVHPGVEEEEAKPARRRSRLTFAGLRRRLVRRLDRDFARLRIEFAPIYRQPESERVYPDLRQRVVAGIFDAILQAIAAFLAKAGRSEVPSHRALGRRLFVEAVRRLDPRIDEVASSFDFLLAVTPINADIAWHDFRASGFQRAPRLLYRPLALEIDVEKRRLHAMSFANLEDPLLTVIYREKQELDMQLTLLELRDTPRFREASRVLYGPVDRELLRIAEEILLPTGRGDLVGEGPRRQRRLCRAARDGLRDGRRLSRAGSRVRCAGRGPRRHSRGNDGIRPAAADRAQHGHGAAPGRGAAQPRGRRASLHLLLRRPAGPARVPLRSRGLRRRPGGARRLRRVPGRRPHSGGFGSSLRAWRAAPRCSMVPTSSRPSGCCTATAALPPPARSASRCGSIAPAASPRTRSTCAGCWRSSTICGEGLARSLLARQVLDRASADHAGARRPRPASGSAGPPGVPVPSRAGRRLEAARAGISPLAMAAA